MPSAYIVGHITVKNPDLWAEYRRRVPQTTQPWGGEIVFRGNQVAALSGTMPHPEIVVSRFPSVEAVNNWFSSAAYQELLRLREQAADVDLFVYEA